MNISVQQALSFPEFSFAFTPNQYNNFHSSVACTMAAADSSNNNVKVRWGIIGLGDVCTIKAGPAFYKAQNSTLAAVMRRTPGMAQSWIDDNVRANIPN
jgi:hypothetical protein